MEKKLILGISSSPRKGANTDILLDCALKAAEEYDFIKTETIYLRDYEIHPCNSCFACCTEVAERNGGEYACLSFRDDMDKIYPKLLECSGMILASPVYFGSINSQMKMFMDRTEGVLRYGFSKYAYGLSGKVGAGIAIGGNRNAGEEFTLQCMHYYFHIHDMIVVGAGDAQRPGAYLGGAGTTHPKRGHDRHAVLEDELGLKSSGNTGRKVAKTIGQMNGLL